ncbi:MAG: glycosyltransferase family 4 protein [Rhodospirillaceae bacterium]
MRILTFTTLYPNAARPNHGVFVETRLRQVLAQGSIEARVIAPVPWFPWTNHRFGTYAAYGRAPRTEERHGIKVWHPRYPVVPKVGMVLAPVLLAIAARPAVARMLNTYPFELIDAHYFYPDGIAAVMLGRLFRKPVVITARGSDVNVIPDFTLPRKMIQWAALQADRIVTVSQALQQRLVALGVQPGCISVLRNGVDLDLFRPLDRDEARKRLGFSGTTLFSVGHLVAAKGHDIAIRALAQLPECRLVIAGQGPQGRALTALAQALGVAGRVTFVGDMPQRELAVYYAAADALVLMSRTEGWPNVLLESMACGTPVITTDVGGTPEVVRAPEAGVLLRERTPEALADAVKQFWTGRPDRTQTRRYAERFGWAATASAQLALYNDVVSRFRAPGAARAAEPR